MWSDLSVGVVAYSWWMSSSDVSAASLLNEVLEQQNNRKIVFFMARSHFHSAFSIFCDTSNRINKRLIILKGNSSGFNRILITAYRCLLVSLKYHAFLLFAFFFCLFSRMCTDKMVSNGTAESQLLFLIHSIIHVFYSTQTQFYRG